MGCCTNRPSIRRACSRRSKRSARRWTPTARASRCAGSPDNAVAFAEAVRLIADFDLAVCRKVIAMIGDPAAPGVPIAVNLSGRSLESSIFFSALLALCKTQAGLARHLLFELTES